MTGPARITMTDANSVCELLGRIDPDDIAELREELASVEDRYG